MKKLLSLAIVITMVVVIPPATGAKTPAATAKAPPTVEVIGDNATERAVPSGFPEAAALQDLLWDNGPMTTHPGGGFNGADVSVLQTALGMNTYGFGHQVTYGYRMGDDFTVPEGCTWDLEAIQFYAYQTGTYGYPPASTMTGVYYQIWDGPPDDPGSSVMFGDLVTNRLANSVWSNIYRATDYDPLNSTRPIMADTATAGVVLQPGTYWLDWMTDGTLSSGPWAPPISILGEITTGNALQYTGAWAPALDTGTSTQQGMPFRIYGTEYCGCEPPTDVDLQWYPDYLWYGVVSTFTGTAAGTEPLTYAWDFGDGSTTEGNPVDHTYVEPGEYDITLCVSNACGVSCASYAVTVWGEPEVIWHLDPEEPQISEPFTVTLELVGWNGPPVVSYGWQFCDGSSYVGNPVTLIVEPEGYMYIDRMKMNARLAARPGWYNVTTLLCTYGYEGIQPEDSEVFPWVVLICAASVVVIVALALDYEISIVWNDGISITKHDDPTPPPPPPPEPPPASRPEQAALGPSSHVPSSATISRASLLGGVPIEGAMAYGQWVYPDGTVHPQDAALLTDARGRTKFPVKEPLCGLYQFCVTYIGGKGSWAYAFAWNHDGPCEEIVVPCP